MLHTACVWSEKLPFAGYSVVKELANLRFEARDSGFGLTAQSPIPNPERPESSEPGGEYRARTGDLLVANQALSQLS
jgi:hypothetical protein